MTIKQPPQADKGSEPDLRALAIANLRRRHEFKIHASTYVLVNLLLIGVWAIVGWRTGQWFPWPVFPLAGWGIGVFFHAWAVYGQPITEERIEREVARLSRHE